jgi:hypothetical protein
LNTKLQRSRGRADGSTKAADPSPRLFRGRTAEEAVLTAIAALGEDAEVVDARRVRRAGVLGLFAGEHVEVTARPRGGAPSTFERTLHRAIDDRARDHIAMDGTVVDDRLVDLRGVDLRGVDLRDVDLRDVDLRDVDLRGVDLRGVDLRDDVDLRDGARARDTPPTSRLPARFGDDDLVPLPDPPAGTEARAILSLAPPPPLPAGIAVAANPAVIDLRSHAQNRARAAQLAPPPPPPPPQQPRPARARSVVDLISGGDGSNRETSTVRWGRAELRAIAVPQVVLDHLPVADPVSDALWTMALETAIWWALRKHRPRTNLVVDGYGAEGAMALLEAVVEGHVIRYLHLGERSVDATPQELAKAVRSCLPR